MFYRWFLCLLMGFALVPRIEASGSGFNVVVVANQNSSNSLALANYYAERRGVPPENVLRIDWTGGRNDWSYSDFSTYLLEPLNAMLANRALTNQANYLVLSMDIPYRTVQGTSMNSTTSALYYGFKTNDPAPAGGLPDSCSLPAASSNSLAGSEIPFRSIQPGSLGATNLMATMITASNLALAKLIVDQGTGSDELFPTQTVWLAKGTDYDRNIRFWQYDDAIFNTRLQGNYSIKRTDAAGPGGLGNILGFQSGAYNYGLGTTWFTPGAIADNLTSFGGQIFQDNGSQLNILTLMAAGASGSYGTVVEPCAYLSKFPSPEVYFYQSRGFTLAESYYQSITNPYQGLLLGEPLAAPFAASGAASWALMPEALLRGSTNLTVTFAGPDARHPVQQVDLFVDGRWRAVLTNIPPAAGNRLQAVVNGRTISYTVPAGASLQSIATGWASAFNTLKNQTKVQAQVHGDRIELQYTELATAGPLAITVQSLQGTAPVLTTLAYSAQPTFLESSASGIRAYTVSGTASSGSVLGLSVTKTNGVQITVTVTNSSSLTLYEIAQQLQTAVNSGVLGTSPDGLRLIDLVNRSGVIDFNLQANSAGWQAAQLQVARQGDFTFSPSTTAKLDENLEDLRPHNNLFIAAGWESLSVSFPFDSTEESDGFHKLTAIAYEGSHVRTQTRVTLAARIQNHDWAAELIPLLGGSNTLINATLSFQVKADIPHVNTIELFGTGGRLGASSGQSNATFTVSGPTLGAGLHPFYAVVTSTDGATYRTETQWIRLVTEVGPFTLQFTTPPPLLVWPAVAGQSYEILGTTNLSTAFAPVATITPTSSLGQWQDASGSDQRLYRIRTAQ